MVQNKLHNLIGNELFPNVYNISRDGFKARCMYVCPLVSPCIYSLLSSIRSQKYTFLNTFKLTDIRVNLYLELLSLKTIFIHSLYLHPKSNTNNVHYYSGRCTLYTTVDQKKNLLRYERRGKPLQGWQVAV